jgi:hypothetical protein
VTLAVEPVIIHILPVWNGRALRAGAKRYDAMRYAGMLRMI